MSEEVFPFEELQFLQGTNLTSKSTISFSVNKKIPKRKKRVRNSVKEKKKVTETYEVVKSLPITTTDEQEHHFALEK